MNWLLEFVLEIDLKLVYSAKTFMAKPTKGEFTPGYSKNYFRNLHILKGDFRFTNC
jgi:hypothetical protein